MLHKWPILRAVLFVRWVFDQRFELFFEIEHTLEQIEAFRSLLLFFGSSWALLFSGGSWAFIFSISSRSLLLVGVFAGFSITNVAVSATVPIVVQFELRMIATLMVPRIPILRSVSCLLIRPIPLLKTSKHASERIVGAKVFAAGRKREKWELLLFFKTHTQLFTMNLNDQTTLRRLSLSNSNLPLTLECGASSLVDD